MKNLFILIFMMAITACSCMKYESDLGAFVSSAQANSAEYPVKINGVECVSMQKKPGLCAGDMKSDENFFFSMEKRPYSYRLVLTCTSSISSNFTVDVLEDKAFEYVIPAEKLSKVKSFTCRGEIFPHDRNQEISAFWEARILIKDKQYPEREKISLQGDTLVLGQNSKYATVNGSKSYKKKTFIKAKGVSKVWTESETMRVNSYGY